MKRLVTHRDQNEAEALERRMRKREKEEAKQECERILTGNLKPSETYIKTDKVIQIHTKMQNTEDKSKVLPISKVKRHQCAQHGNMPFTSCILLHL